MSWKQQANKRRNFRQSKPEIKTRHKKKAIKKPVKLMVKLPDWGWVLFGRYANIIRAEEAMKSKKQDYLYKDCDFKILKRRK